LLLPVVGLSATGSIYIYAVACTEYLIWCCLP
jgi:hypothetical protein